MKKQTEPLETLSEIRSLMERSSRFISLNGLSGVFAGVFALIGAGVAYLYLNDNPLIELYTPGLSESSFLVFFIADAFLVLFASVSAAVFFSVRKAHRKGLKIWDATARRLLINLLIPLSAGGIFCLILLYHGVGGLIAPATLIFYGLALINAGKYTYNDIRYLGMVELALGLIASFWVGYGLFFWSVGFGLVHIVYGVTMYYKYER